MWSKRARELVVESQPSMQCCCVQACKQQTNMTKKKRTDRKEVELVNFAAVRQHLVNARSHALVDSIVVVVVIVPSQRANHIA